MLDLSKKQWIILEQVSSDLLLDAYLQREFRMRV